jgi:hypothetical protein
MNSHSSKHRLTRLATYARFCYKRKKDRANFNREIFGKRDQPHRNYYCLTNLHLTCISMLQAGHIVNEQNSDPSASMFVRLEHSHCSANLAATHASNLRNTLQARDSGYRRRRRKMPEIVASALNAESVCEHLFMCHELLLRYNLVCVLLCNADSPALCTDDACFILDRSNITSISECEMLHVQLILA